MTSHSLIPPVIISETECLWLLGILGHKAAQDWSYNSLGEFMGHLTASMETVHSLSHRYDISLARLHHKQERFTSSEMAEGLHCAIEFVANKKSLEETVALYTRSFWLDEPDAAQEHLLKTFSDIRDRHALLEPFAMNRDALFTQVGDLDHDVLVGVGRHYFKLAEQRVLRPAA